jgi:hypothetical protein
VEKVLDDAQPSDWIRTIPDGPYQNDGWLVIKLVHDGKQTGFVEKHPEIRKALDYFKCPIVMGVYYSMLPGTKLHPHRDLDGTLEFGRLRFHIPVHTNPSVNFMVSHKRVPMAEGEMWALNTSYMHAVENNGQTDRVHFVVEVEANEWCWQQLPKKNAKFYVHYAAFLGLIFFRAVKLLFTDWKAVKYRLRMGKFFLNRLLRRSA